MVADQEIEVYVINGKRYSLFILSILLIGTGVLIFLAKVFLLLGLISLIIFWVGPIFIQKRIRSPFLKKIDIGFSFDKISIELFNKEGERLEKKIEIYYHQIKAFKIINSDKDDTSYLKIICKDGQVISFSFTGQSNEGGKTDVTDLVVKYIHQFNNKQLPEDRITLIPSFFASKKGTVYIAILTLVLIVVLIYQIISKPSTIPFSIFASLLLTLQIISQRKRDLQDLNDFNNSVE